MKKKSHLHYDEKKEKKKSFLYIIRESDLKRYPMSVSAHIQLYTRLKINPQASIKMHVVFDAITWYCIIIIIIYLRLSIFISELSPSERYDFMTIFVYVIRNNIVYLFHKDNIRILSYPNIVVIISVSCRIITKKKRGGEGEMTK